MKSKNIQSLPKLITAAQEAGARLVARQMSMDMMSIKPEGMIEGIKVGGVATSLNQTDKVNATLFVQTQRAKHIRHRPI